MLPAGRREVQCAWACNGCNDGIRRHPSRVPRESGVGIQYQSICFSGYQFWLPLVVLEHPLQLGCGITGPFQESVAVRETANEDFPMFEDVERRIGLLEQSDDDERRGPAIGGGGLMLIVEGYVV